MKLKNGLRADEAGMSARMAGGLIIFLIVGGILGFGLSSFLANPEENTVSENCRHVVSRVSNLEKRIQTLESVLSNYSASDNFTWPIPAIYQQAVRSVVKIEVITITESFFGQQRSTALGSGFVYNDSGYIISNEHVVGEAEEITVTFSNGDTVEASLVATDPYSDIGVIKVDPSKVENLEPLNLGDSSGLEVGERVIAIGNPFGLSRTVTTGIVSQTGRLLQTETGYSIPSVIQIDAAINPGSSGGPLLDFGGRVIGITTAIETQTGTFTGVGFAVPSALVRKVVADLIEKGEYKHPWIGIGGQNVTFEIAEEKGLEKARGFLISYVGPDSPADKAGLQEGDVVLAIDGREIFGLEDILSYIELNARPDEMVNLQVFRDGKIKSLELKLGVRPSP